MKDTEFEIFHGDTLLNEWDMMREQNPAKKPRFDAIVANPPFSYRWNPPTRWPMTCASRATASRPSPPPTSPSCCTDSITSRRGWMAIILPHGVLFPAVPRNASARSCSRTATSTPSSACPRTSSTPPASRSAILVLKNAEARRRALHQCRRALRQSKRQNQLSAEHIAKIIATYQHRTEEARYSRRVEMAEIEKNDCNLNISRYISTAVGGGDQPKAIHDDLVEIENAINTAKAKTQSISQRVGLGPLPQPGKLWTETPGYPRIKLSGTRRSSLQFGQDLLNCGSGLDPCRTSATRLALPFSMESRLA